MLFSNRFKNSHQLKLASANSPPLRYGSNGQGVEELQDVLHRLGKDKMFVRSFNSGKADGIYGLETKDAVLSFQRDNMLVPDGVAGANTLRLLDTVILGDPHLDRPDPQGFVLQQKLGHSAPRGQKTRELT